MAVRERIADRIRRRTPLESGFALSLLLHAAVFAVFSWERSVDFADGAVDPMEIDLSRPFRITDDPRLARRALNPGAGAPVVQKPTPIAGKGAVGGEEEGPADGKGAAKDWVLPTPQTTQLETPAPGEAAGRPDGQGEGAGLGGLGGEGDGEVDWVYLTELPRLLNVRQLQKDVLRYYPPEARAAGRESRVILAVHINAQGRVARVSVVTSGGGDFDEAARKVASQARFSPAKVQEKAVPVKLQLPLEFNLD